MDNLLLKIKRKDSIYIESLSSTSAKLNMKSIAVKDESSHIQSNNHAKKSKFIKGDTGNMDDEINKE